MLTDQEHKCLESISNLYKEMLSLVGPGPSRTGDLGEIVLHIHALQNMVLAQGAAREYPELYRLMGDQIQPNKKGQS